nr:MAG TPA: hypothetical protein [Caudoviricetes sp.]
MAEPHCRPERQWRFHSSTRHTCNVRSKYRLHLMGQSICSSVLKLLSQVESWKSIFSSFP